MKEINRERKEKGARPRESILEVLCAMKRIPSTTILRDNEDPFLPADKASKEEDETNVRWTAGKGRDIHQLRDRLPLPKKR